MDTKILTIASMVILLAIGVGVGWGFETTVSPGGSVTTTTSQASGPFVLNLVVTTENTFNSSTGTQPAFYVLTPQGGLRSAANLSLPANRLIKLVIVNYDNGNASLLGTQYANVQGTVNGTISYVNNANVNSSQGAKGIDVKGGVTVTSVSPADIAHTFTIPQLGINIPLPLSSTVTAYVKIDRAGSFQWMCETACGSGAAGLLGAMETPGWMVGNVEVS